MIGRAKSWLVWHVLGWNSPPFITLGIRPSFAWVRTGDWRDATLLFDPGDE